MLNPRLVADIVRHELNLPDNSQDARIIMLIPDALRGYARKIAADEYLRPLLTTDRSATVLPLMLGVTALEPLYSTYNVMKEYLSDGQIYLIEQYYLFEPDNISAARDEIRISGNTLTVQMPVKFKSDGVLPTPLNTVDTYYVQTVNVIFGIFTLSTDVAGLDIVDFTDTGSGIFTIIAQNFGFPMKPIAPQGQAFPKFLDDYKYYNVDSGQLRVQNADNTVPTGGVAFACPYYPATLADLPDDASQERMFLEKLVELCTMQKNDAAEDGAH